MNSHFHTANTFVLYTLFCILSYGTYMYIELKAYAQCTMLDALLGIQTKLEQK